MRKMLIAIITMLLVFTGISIQASEVAKEGAKDLFEKKCGQCHSTDRAKSQKRTASEWESTVAKMKKNGCSITDVETKTIIQYLTENYGK